LTDQQTRLIDAPLGQDWSARLDPDISTYKKNTTHMRKVCLLLASVAIGCWHCKNQTTTPPTQGTAQAEVPKPVQLQTHAEASDTLRADTSAPLKPLRYTSLTPSAATEVIKNTDFQELLVAPYPDNGFYGADRYRIEFIFTEVTRYADDPSVFFVKGKNRYKKTVSNFEGTLKITQLRQFTDLNMDPEAIDDALGEIKTYAAAGEFTFDEDRSLASSGQFKGQFQLEYTTPRNADEALSLWFYSDNSPAEGSGYRFDGMWTSYTKADMKKPVLWSRDLFRFANNILEDFSYGERDIEINEKYRALGWDNFWDGEEWWTDAKSSSAAK
jgi:hypothetical protein